MFSIDYEDRGTPAPAPAAASVTLEIDGTSVTVPEGTSLMRAAALADVKVPKLCATDTLKAFGSCRLCGRRPLRAAGHGGRGRHHGELLRPGARASPAGAG